MKRGVARRQEVLEGPAGVHSSRLLVKERLKTGRVDADSAVTDDGSSAIAVAAPEKAVATESNAMLSAA